MIGPHGSINPLNDYAFLKALGEKGAEQQLLALINAVLTEAKQPTLKWLKITPRHFKAADIENAKECILDVEAIADNGKVNIEVQISDKGNIQLRLLFYWAKLFTDGFEKGQDYKQLPKVFVVAILNYNVSKHKNFINHWMVKNTITGEVFNNALHIFTIEMKKFRKLKNKNINNPLHQWLLFLDEKTKQNIINNLINMNADIKQAHDRLQHVMQNSDTYSMYVKRKIAQMDYNNGIKTAEERGVKKGVRKGRKQGKEVGIRIGVQQGLEKGKMEMILEMHNIGLSVETIAQAAKKSVNDVLAVVNKQKMKEKVFAV